MNKWELKCGACCKQESLHHMATLRDVFYTTWSRPCWFQIQVCHGFAYCNTTLFYSSLTTFCWFYSSLLKLFDFLIFTSIFAPWALWHITCVAKIGIKLSLLPSILFTFLSTTSDAVVNITGKIKIHFIFLLQLGCFRLTLHWINSWLLHSIFGEVKHMTTKD